MTPTATPNHAMQRTAELGVVCASEAGANAGESPAGRIKLFTTENCVGGRGCEASGVSTAQIGQQAVMKMNRIQ